jgi:hypothetical protein
MPGRAAAGLGAPQNQGLAPRGRTHRKGADFGRLNCPRRAFDSPPVIVQTRKKQQELDMLRQQFRLAVQRLKRLLSDDRGEHATEFLMILTFGVLPIIAAVFLLQDVFKEYVAFGQIFVSSPFF